MDVIKYMGIPYKRKGYDFDGADCYGLVHLFLKTELGIELPLFEEFDVYSEEQKISTEKQILAQAPILIGEKTMSPECGDIVVLRLMGRATHIGVYLEDNKILHIMNGTNASIERLDRGRLKGHLDGIYKLKREK